MTKKTMLTMTSNTMMIAIGLAATRIIQPRTIYQLSASSENAQVVKKRKLETNRTLMQLAPSRPPSHDNAIWKERKISKIQIGSRSPNDTESEGELWGVSKGTAPNRMGRNVTHATSVQQRGARSLQAYNTSQYSLRPSSFFH
jgi:hypothetical protein